MKPRALILRTAGTNCDRELAHAFALAGAEPVTVHLSRLIDEPTQLAEYQLIGFPGGFSYGDDIAAGRILANRLRHRLLEPLLDAVDRGVPMIGVCNGFQVLVKLGLLPLMEAGADGLTSAAAVTSAGRAAQVVTLADNTSGRFLDRWVPLRAEAESVCLWTRGIDEVELPIAHGEGRFKTDGATLQALEHRGQIALRYAENPNGSQGDVAGICDPSGCVFGLMPHPERFTDPTNHPQWTRRGPKFLHAEAAGLRFFRNAVESVGGGGSSKPQAA